jgi:hypothetical protein
LRKALLFFVVGVVSLTPACGADEADPFPDPDLPVVAANPDGDAYPTDNIGGRKRSGTRRGDRMPNFTFKGYRSGRAGGLEDIAIAEFYDPHQKRNKILHLQLAATWCSICSSELTATMTVAEELKKRGVAFFEIVVSGAHAGKGPALSEVDQWVDRHGTTFPTGIDVAARRLGTVGVSGSAMPHDIMIDTRTMEILDSSVGAPLDVGKYVQAGLEFVTNSPPSY